MGTDFDYIIEMRNINKYFGKVVALKNINFRVGINEVVGLIGDNGAGKSTLIKILTGVFPPSDGEIFIRGRKINTAEYTARKAHELRIETVYQEKALGEKQSLWRNIFIGRQITKPLGFIDIKREREETERIMKELIGFRGEGVGSESSVSRLSGGERQGIAIGRAMYFEADLIILDEPTVALSLKEVGKVISFIKKIREAGKSCVIISHNIHEAYSVSDRFVLIDRGEIVGEYNVAEYSCEEITEMFLRVCK
jgi:simple sugar transport system ATP-binding protein